MKLSFNDGSFLNIETLTAVDGVMTIRVLRTDHDELRKYFGNEFATSLMTCNGTTYEGYTIIERITEYTGAIWEVVMDQAGETPTEKFEKIDATTKSIASDVTDIQMALVELYELIGG